MAGTKDQIQGKAREVKGKMTPEEAEELTGNAQSLKGKLEATADWTKNKLLGKAEELKGKARQCVA